MMTSSLVPPSTPQHVDPYVIEQLVRAMSMALERSSLKNPTTPSEVLSALFTMLDRTLRAMKELEATEDIAGNTHEVASALNGLLMEFGMDLN